MNRRNFIAAPIGVLALLAASRAGACPTSYANAFGDSITYGAGPNPYVGLLASATGNTFENWAYPGDQAADQIQSIYQRDKYPLSIYAIGANDQRLYLTDTNLLKSFTRMHLAGLAWLAIPNANIITGVGGSVTYTGTWTPTGAYGLGKTSWQAGDTASFTTAAGKNLLIGNILQNGISGKASVSVDGNVLAIVSTLPEGGTNITTYNGATYSGAAILIPNLPYQAHDVVITSLAPTDGSNPFYFDWACALGGSGANPTWPRVIAATVTRQSSLYPWGGSDDNVENYSRTVALNVERLRLCGLNVYLADTHNYVNPETDLTDGIHPNEQGNINLRNAFLDALALP